MIVLKVLQYEIAAKIRLVIRVIAPNTDFLPIRILPSVGRDPSCHTSSRDVQNAENSRVSDMTFGASGLKTGATLKEPNDSKARQMELREVV
jgi:hypothetical protein